MKHPLVNPSLTPVGFVFPNSRRRVSQILPRNGVNGDFYAAKFWQKKNCLLAPDPKPAEVIVHTIMPALSKRGRTKESDFMFSGKPYLSRDIMVLSTFMQWFGTNVGSGFIRHKPFRFKSTHPLREFREKFVLENTDNTVSARLIHICNDKCEASMSGLGRVCCLTPELIQPRDLIVIDSLMHWLGTKAGRQYMTDYDLYIKKICNRVRAEWGMKQTKRIA
ncbi:hypothetical protein KC850_02340 [Candidatus Kaiserbacteria bacterium]|nr:hypothetical protein [Candidatus Kaiserbacteria bacterium]